MSEHIAQVSWKRTTTDFSYDTYDRTHTIVFEGGTEITGSAAPEFKGNAQHANPEETLAASASACHMLTFLAIAAKSRLIVNSYEDRAVATLGKRADGRMAITKIDLYPKVQFEGTPPSGEKLLEMHEKSHRNCFIANSVSCDIETHL